MPEVDNGNASLLDLVKALGEYLTSEEDELRTKGDSLVTSGRRFIYALHYQVSSFCR